LDFKMANAKRIVIVGATSAIAIHCARQWISQGAVRVTLIGRDPSKLDRLALDLRARTVEGFVDTQIGQFDDAAGIQSTIDAITDIDQLDIVLIAHGSLSDQALCQSDLAICQSELLLNGVSPALYAEGFVQKMQVKNHGTIAVIGSVAGDRGRKSNYVYGAAKGMLTRYMQGLQHRLAGSNVKAVLIKPGPTDTPMTAALKSQGAKLAPVEDVATTIVKAIDTGQTVVYAPRKWALIMMIVRHLPKFIFNKMNI
jgi:decaprenylphospho-beta-D-erythro-pentofuranosid-2-ulose 2-reductase